MPKYPINVTRELGAETMQQGTKKLTNDIAKILKKGLVKDPDSLEERFKKPAVKETPKSIIKEANDGYDGRFLYGGHFYNTKTFADEGSAQEWLSYNRDHKILAKEETGKIHCVHVRASGIPQSGIVEVPTLEDTNTIVNDLTLFLEHSPEFLSLQDNIQVKRNDPNVKIHALHLNKLIDHDDDSAWMQFVYQVSEAYEAKFGEAPSMVDMHEALNHWITNYSRASKAHARSSNDKFLTGGISRDNMFRSSKC